MKTFKQLSALILMLVLTILAGCSGGSSSTPPTDPGSKPESPAAGGGSADKNAPVVVALESDVPTLDPHMHNERVAIIVNWNLFDSLLTRDPESMEVVPHLAESIKAVDDLTWELKLRKGVTFHNGEEFNAEAVKFSFERVLNPEQKSPQRGNVSAVKEVKIIDSHTVQLITEKPYPLLPERLTYFCMVPPKYLGEVGDEKFATDPVGTGPYKFTEWVKGEKVVLTANDQYWKGAPKVRSVVFRNIPEQATRLNELAAGGVHIVRQVSPDLVPQIESAGNRVDSAPILRVWHLDLNPAYKPFDDKNFRKAMLHAINVDLIIKEIFQGKATRVPALVNAKQFGFDPSVQPARYDPELAKQFLAKSSYNGEKVVLHHFWQGAGQAVIDAIQADLKAIGIDVEIKFYPEIGAFVEVTRGGKVGLEGGQWGSYGMFDADAILEPLLHKDGAYGAHHQFHPEQNAWIDEARSTVDPEKRKAAYSKLQKAVMEEAMTVSLFAPDDIYGINKGLNYEPRADEIIYVYDASWK